MSPGEIVFYIGFGIGDFLIATEWAKYGIMEIGVQKPLNKNAFTGAFIGVMTIFIGGLAHRFYGFNISNLILGIITGVAILWLLVFRYVLMPKGLFQFNKAKIRTNFWSITGNYIPGEILTERANSLKEFGLAKGAVKMFRQSVELQLKGDTVWRLNKTMELDDNKLNEWDNTYRIRCPACPFEMRIPNVKGRNMSGTCGVCGSVSTVRIEGNTLHMSTILPKATRIVSDKNRYNAAVGHEEMALLYRMMDMFDEAREALQKSMELTEQLLGNEPESQNYLKLKSLVIFRLAEIDHIQGSLEAAKTGYKKSLEIDQRFQDQEGIQTTTHLLEKIQRTER